jgi:fatty acid desaturase
MTKLVLPGWIWKNPKRVLTIVTTSVPLIATNLVVAAIVAAAAVLVVSQFSALMLANVLVAVVMIVGTVAHVMKVVVTIGITEIVVKKECNNYYSHS